MYYTIYNYKNEFLKYFNKVKPHNQNKITEEFQELTIHRNISDSAGAWLTYLIPTTYSSLNIGPTYMDLLGSQP